MANSTNKELDKAYKDLTCAAYKDLTPAEWKEAYLAVHDELARAEKHIDLLNKDLTYLRGKITTLEESLREERLDSIAYHKKMDPRFGD